MIAPRRSRNLAGNPRIERVRKAAFMKAFYISFLFVFYLKDNASYPFPSFPAMKF